MTKLLYAYIIIQVFTKGGIPRGDKFRQKVNDILSNKKVGQWNTLSAENCLFVAHNYFIATLNYSQQ